MPQSEVFLGVLLSKYFSYFIFSQDLEINHIFLEIIQSLRLSVDIFPELYLSMSFLK